MNKLVVWTYDWVPEEPRGFVRDLRLTWACEEAGRQYCVRTVPLRDRGDDHFARQTYGQGPFLTDADWGVDLGGGVVCCVFDPASSADDASCDDGSGGSAASQ